MHDTEAVLCPRCGNPLGHEAVEGVCAQCLLDPTWNSNPSIAGDESSPDPLRIGRYRLLELIGEGGFGAVYAAEQESPVCRRVALKVIKPGMDTRQVVARFQAERQALALMDHPNIAHVLDAGATDAGRPYFVMEWVQGLPLTRHCDDHRLTMRERLELFVLVCRAVQHAHQKGVIHRDLKPSNVLVATIDGRAVPKVIDFGIAKAIQGPLADRTALTEARQFLGTPEYMSPEQGGGEPAGDIDTRSDVYSLGALLYELLTGTTPFTAHELRGKPHDRVQQTLREVDPPRPSSRVESLAGAAGDAVAERRGTQSKRLEGALRGDLDWIVMKCLEKDRTRRYDSPGALADDIERSLKGDPVSAGAPSRAYRLRKFVRRHRTAVVAVTGVATALVVGLGGTTYGLLRATKDRNDALRARGDEAFQRQLADARLKEAEAARGLAEQSLAETLAATHFLGDLLGSASAYGGRGESFTVRQALDESARLILRGSLRDKPAAEATVQRMVADSFASVGGYRQAVEHAKAALQTRRRLYPGDNDAVADALASLASAQHLQGDSAEAERNASQALDMLVRLHGTDDVRSAGVLETLGAILEKRFAHIEAEVYFNRALALRKKHQGNGHRDVAIATFLLGNTQHSLGKFKEAEQSLRDAVAISTSAVGEDDLGTSSLVEGLAQFVFMRVKADDGIALQRRSLETARKLLSPSHVLVAFREAKLAQMLNARHSGDDLKEAEGLCRSSIAILLQARGADHWQVSTVYAQLSKVLRQSGDLAGARAATRQAVEADVRRYTAQLDQSPGDAPLFYARAHTHARIGEFDKALADYDAALRIDPSQHYWRYHRAVIRLYQRDVVGYRADCEELLARFGQSEDLTIMDRTAKVCLLHSPPVGDPEELVRMVNHALSAKPPLLLVPWLHLAKGMAEQKAGRPREAIKWLDDIARRGPPPGFASMVDHYRAMAFQSMNQPEDAAAALLRAQQSLKQIGVEFGLDDLDPTGPGAGGMENHLIIRLIARDAAATVKSATAVGTNPNPM